MNVKKNKIDPDPKKILGMTGEEILATFYENIQLKKINMVGNSKLI